MTVLTEMIKKEGEKFVLYSKDGSKVLGKFDTKDEAMKREKEMMAAMAAKSKMGEGFAIEVATGHLILAEGARLKLTEEAVDMGAMSDDDLRGARKTFMGLYAQCCADHSAMGDSRYNTPEGVTCMADCSYYAGIVRSLEYHMQSRLLTLE
jgi:hypothetical protein